jgi:LysR family hydrogen peroxide-inducible transcriptional activator
MPATFRSPRSVVAIKKLEEELQVKLFERNANEITVTPLGEEIVRQAQSVLEQADNIREIAKRGKDPLAGPLRLGVIYTIGPYLLPDLVRQAIANAADAADAAGKLHRQAARELRTGEIDCAILAEPFPDANLAIAPLYDEPFMAAVPSGHPLAALKGVTAEELKKETMLLLGTGHCFRDHVLEVCPEFARFSSSTEGIRKSFEGSSLETIKHMVAAGMGITLVPRLGVPKEALLEPAPAKKTAKGKAAGSPRNGVRPSSLPSSNTCPSKARCRAGAWCWPGGAASRAMRPLPRCAMPSTPASCPASSACLESRLWRV